MLGSLNMTTAFPVIAGLFVLLFFAYYCSVLRPRRGSLEWISRELSRDEPVRFSLRRHPADRRDVLPVLVITALYAVVAFLNLGDTTGIESFHRFTEASPRATLELSRETTLSRVDYFTGIWSGSYVLSVSEDGVVWYELAPAGESDGAAMPQEYSNLLKWRTAYLPETGLKVRYVTLRAENLPMELGEVALFDGEGRAIPWYYVSSQDAPELVDEPDKVPEHETCLNSAYFDEIYHVRTARENYLNVYPYEISHPPLGKLIICLGLALFGTTPFGWRFMGTLFGVLMLPALYFFLKNLFGKRSVSVCGTLLLAFDFMHFTQTRIATIDTYGVFFILLMYWMMYRYLTVPADAPFRKSVTPAHGNFTFNQYWISIVGYPVHYRFTDRTYVFWIAVYPVIPALRMKLCAEYHRALQTSFGYF